MNDSKIVITEYKGQNSLFHFEDGELTDYISFSESSINVNDIYVGRISNVKKELNACFVNISPDVTGFLPDNEIVSKYLINREYDGRLLQGDLILCQVNKDRIKTKEYGLTMNITIPGAYSVVTATDNALHFSSKLNKEQRERIHNALDSVSLKYGAVIRTMAGKVDPDEVKSELNALSDSLENVLSVYKTRSLYTKLYSGKPEVFERIKSIRSGETVIITDVPDIYNMLKDDFDIKLYEDTFPLKSLYSFERAFDYSHNKKVNLKSGGSIIIEPTEALTVIDVNSGKNDKKLDKEKLIYLTNKEAAVEIAKQLRLRNISGIILVDFINMTDKGLLKDIVSLIKTELKRDIYKASFIDVTPLGLVEITREKRYQSVYDKLK